MLPLLWDWAARLELRLAGCRPPAPRSSLPSSFWREIGAAPGCPRHPSALMGVRSACALSWARRRQGTRAPQRCRLPPLGPFLSCAWRGALWGLGGPSGGGRLAARPSAPVLRAVHLPGWASLGSSVNGARMAAIAWRGFQNTREGVHVYGKSTFWLGTRASSALATFPPWLRGGIRGPGRPQGAPWPHSPVAELSPPLSSHKAGVDEAGSLASFSW